MPDYRISGFSVSSELELPGAIPVERGAAPADIQIRRSPVPAALVSPTLRGPGWALNRDHFLLDLPSGGRFLASHGRSLDLDIPEDLDPMDGLPFVLGTGIAALVLQRGGLILHGSAVVDGDRAYILCGPSGEGKSTLAAALCRQGCTLLSDDVSSVGIGAGGEIVVWPDGRQLKLYEDSIDRLKLEDLRIKPVRTGLGKFYVEPPAPGRHEPAVVAGIYLLRKAEPKSPDSIEPMARARAAQLLSKENYRPRIARGIVPPTLHLALTSAILRQAPVFLYKRARDIDRLEASARALIDHWRGADGGG